MITLGNCSHLYLRIGPDWHQKGTIFLFFLGRSFSNKISDLKKNLQIKICLETKVVNINNEWVVFTPGSRAHSPCTEARHRCTWCTATWPWSEGSCTLNSCTSSQPRALWRSRSDYVSTVHFTHFIINKKKNKNKKQQKNKQDCFNEQVTQ